MTTNIFPVTAFETKAREIMSEAFKDAFDEANNSVQAELAKTFVADYSSSRTASAWVALAETLGGCGKIDDQRARKAFTRMVKKGWLRSRGSNYEVNY